MHPVDRGNPGVVFAPLGVEACALRAGSHGMRVVRCGVGRERASRAIRTAPLEPGEAIAVGGLCGSLGSEFAPGDLVVPDELRAKDLPPHSIDGASLRRLLGGHGWRVHGGVLMGVDRKVTGDARSRLRESGALAVDMESPWLADAAGSRPFAVLRVVVDGPQHELIRPGTIYRGWKALVRLREASAVLDEWVSHARHA